MAFWIRPFIKYDFPTVAPVRANTISPSRKMYEDTLYSSKSVNGTVFQFT